MVADALGMSKVFAHPLGGVLSAYGMGLADQNVIREAAIEQDLASSLDVVTQKLNALADEAEGELRRQGVTGGEVKMHRRVHVRYKGTDSALVVAAGSLKEIQEAFEAAYRQRFAFLMNRELVVEAVSVEAVGASQAMASVPIERTTAERRRGVRKGIII